MTTHVSISTHYRRSQPTYRSSFSAEGALLFGVRHEHDHCDLSGTLAEVTLVTLEGFSGTATFLA